MSVKMAGQTISDRLLAAKHSIAGQGLAKSVCKATTEEMIGPKKKHLDYLIHCTNEPNVSIPQLANLLIERSQNTNWVVVYKALITVHHMLCYGNERFTQYLASSNSTFQLSNFLDKSGVQGYDMSPFIRRYAKYLNEKALSYRTVAFDFCKVKRGKEDGTLRTMNAEHLLKTLPVLQSQLDGLLEFDCTSNDLTNGVINMCFMLLFRDLIRLFACYNDGIINLLEKYFDMNKKQCRDALDLYKKFLIRMDRVAEFLKVAENVGIDKGDIPDLTKAPSSLLDALEQHLAAVEGKKGSAANTPTQTARDSELDKENSNRTNVKSGVNALSSTSTAFGTAAANARLEAHANGIDETLKQQVLAEEEAAMNQYKAKVSSPTGNGPSTHPFLSSPTISSTTNPIVDLFGSPPAVDNNQGSRASDDLLQLSGNPFADIFGGTAPAPTTTAPPVNNNNDMWMSNGFQPTGQQTNSFVSDQGFASVFGGTDSSAAGMSQPPNPFSDQHAAPSLGASDDFFGGDLFGGDNSLGSEKPEEEKIRPLSGFPPAPAPSPIVGVGASPPPPRPPPPSAVGGSGQGSPAPIGASPSRPAPASKSAFDDLNDSIRMALGGSPSKPAPIGAMDGGGGPQQGPMAPGGGGAFPGGAAVGFGSPAKPAMSMTGFDALGDVLNPSVQAGSPLSGGGVAPLGSGAQTAGGKVLTGDLDSSLASLAQNLSINKGGQTAVKGVQWNSPKNAAKPGATGWTPQPMAATTGAGYRPMGQGMTTMNVSVQYPIMQLSSPMGMQGMPGMRPMGPPMGGGGIMGSPRIGGPPMGQPAPGATQPAHQTGAVPLDPFGAL